MDQNRVRKRNCNWIGAIKNEEWFIHGGDVRPGRQNTGTVVAGGGQRERAAGAAGAGIAETAACQGHTNDTIVGIVEAAAVLSC